MSCSVVLTAVVKFWVLGVCLWWMLTVSCSFDLTAVVKFLGVRLCRC